jgi:predicted ATPase
MAEELIALGRCIGDTAVELQGHQALGVTALSRGEPAIALQCMEHAVALYDPHSGSAHSFTFGPDHRAVTKSYGWLALWLLGRPDEAARQCDAAVQLSRDLTPTSRLMALQFAAILDHFRRDPVRASERVEVAKGIAIEHGMTWWQAWDAVMGGWSLAMRSSTPEGVQLVRIGLAELHATGAMSYRTYHLALLAEALAAQNELEQSCRTLDEALELVHQTNERMWEAELHRLRGEMLLQLADGQVRARQRAEEDFHVALMIARQQQALSLELRAAISLVKLHRDSPGESVLARQRLAEIYDQFSEGFDTEDLQTAASLL